MFILTASDVREKQRRAQTLASEIDRLQAEREEIHRWLTAAEVLLGRDISSLLTEEAGDVDDEGEGEFTWRTLLMTTLRNFPEGASYKDLKEAVFESPFRARYERNANALYNAVRRAESRKDIIRSGELFFSPEHYLAWMGKRGLEQVAESPSTRSEAPSGSANELMQDVIRDFLVGLGEVPIPDIRARVEEVPALKEQLRRNSQYIYTVLSRMAKRGEIMRTEGGYKLPDETEAPSVRMEGASDQVTGEGSHPLPVESQRDFRLVG